VSVVSEIRSPRRRRSVAVAPALLDPAELPEDAPGRVRLIAVEAPADIVDAPAPVVPRVASGTSLLGAGGGWIPVAVVGAVIVAIFIVGMLLTRS
jgi:NADPH-dependent 2,4-dienoyl-CoA reductase/sulfur reductase-like enzyme